NLKIMQGQIPENPEAYALIGALREIVEQGSFAAKETVSVYEAGPGGQVTVTKEDAALHIFRGVRPDQRRMHGAGAAIANWHFYTPPGGGKAPFEQAKYFLRNVV